MKEKTWRNRIDASPTKKNERNKITASPVASDSNKDIIYPQLHIFLSYMLKYLVTQNLHLVNVLREGIKKNH